MTRAPDERSGIADGRVLAWPAFRKRSANPHMALLASELVAHGVALTDWTPLRALFRPGRLWHLHFPETVLYRRSTIMSAAETAAFLALLWLARLRGVRMVWTVHDLGSNDHLHPTLERWFWRAYVPAIDALICLSERSRTLVVERFPALAGRPIHVVPLGGFADAYGASVSREDARARLGIGSQTPVMLHFGLLRPYKNVPHLIRTFRARAADDALLLVAGEPYDPIVEREVRQVAEGAGDVRLDLRWIPEDEVQQFFAAADLVVLPYRRILNSGAVLLAMTLARPVLVPDQGAMRDQREAFGADWVRLYEGELTSSTLMEALGWARTTRRRPLPPDLLDWRPRAQQVKAVYEQAITGRTAADPFGNRVASGGLRQ